MSQERLPKGQAQNYVRDLPTMDLQERFMATVFPTKSTGGSHLRTSVGKHLPMIQENEPSVGHRLAGVSEIGLNPFKQTPN